MKRSVNDSLECLLKKTNNRKEGKDGKYMVTTKFVMRTRGRAVGRFPEAYHLRRTRSARLPSDPEIITLTLVSNLPSGKNIKNK